MGVALVLLLQRLDALDPAVQLHLLLDVRGGAVQGHIQ